MYRYPKKANSSLDEIRNFIAQVGDIQNTLSFITDSAQKLKDQYDNPAFDAVIELDAIAKQIDVKSLRLLEKAEMTK
jgi:hypothetical protein